MKLEAGATLIDTDIMYISLNDETLVPESVELWIDGTYHSHGYDDLTTQICAYNSYQTKDDRSIYVHNGSTVLVDGKCISFDVGEIVLSFNVRTGLIINWLVKGS